MLKSNNEFDMYLTFNHFLTVFSGPLVLGLVFVLSIALLTDLTKHKIPNQLVLMGLALGLILQAMTFGWSGVLNWLLGVTFGFVGFLPLYLLKGMAAGDVKLMMAVGGFVGYPLILFTLLYAIIFGGVFAIIYTVFRRRFTVLSRNLYDMTMRMVLKATSKIDTGSVVDEQNSAGKMPYALAIATGTLVAVYKHGHGNIF